MGWSRAVRLRFRICVVMNLVMIMRLFAGGGERFTNRFTVMRSEPETESSDSTPHVEGWRIFSNRFAVTADNRNSRLQCKLCNSFY